MVSLLIKNVESNAAIDFSVPLAVEQFTPREFKNYEKGISIFSVYRANSYSCRSCTVPLMRDMVGESKMVTNMQPVARMI